jgi:hypothetical protein
MRTISLILIAMTLGGCAASPKPKPCTGCGDAPPKASLLQRLGFGRTIGEKQKSANVETFTSDVDISSAPITVESGPTLSVEPAAPLQARPQSSAGPK